jgi:beclin 1
LDLVFTDYDIIPCGSHSFLKAKNGGDKDELPLYGNGGWRPFGQAALDQGIVAFMECFREFEAKIKTHFQAGTQILPYRMTKDKIIDQDSQYLVKMQLNSEERWTKAMKCLLVNLKWSVKIIANLRRTSSSNATS